MIHYTVGQHDNTRRQNDHDGFAGIAEFERDLIRERTGAGRDAAKQRGVRFGRPRKLNTDQAQVAAQLLAEGKSTKEVAVHLDLSGKTAETHRSNIMRKLGLPSVSELVLYAVRNNSVQG